MEEKVMEGNEREKKGMAGGSGVHFAVGASNPSNGPDHGFDY
jgi:hypothetical protein